MTDVLILEDELTSLQALSEILTTYSDDIRVHKASSLKEAKDLLDQEIRYGLFLLDVNLSGEDLPGVALLPVHYEAISQGAGGRGCSEGAGKREQGETTGDRCEKRRDQLSAEMRGYPLSGSDTERNKTASCDGELGCPLCDSQTDAA